MGVRNAIVFAKMSFGLIPKVFNPIDMVRSLHEAFGMIDPEMAEIRDIQRVVTGEAISIDNAIGSNHLMDNGQECHFASIRDNFGVHLTASLENTKDGHLARSPSSPFAFSMAPKVTLIDFDFACDWRTAFQVLGNDKAKTMIKGTSGIPIDPDQFRGGPGRRPGHKVFQQPLGLQGT